MTCSPLESKILPNFPLNATNTKYISFIQNHLLSTFYALSFVLSMTNIEEKNIKNTSVSVSGLRPTFSARAWVPENKFSHNPQVPHGFAPKLSRHSGKNIKKASCVVPSFGGARDWRSCLLSSDPCLPGHRGRGGSNSASRGRGFPRKPAERWSPHHPHPATFPSGVSYVLFFFFPN